MKKYLVSCIFGLLIGFFLCKTVLNEYDSTSSIKVSSKTGISAYFIKYGEYSSKDELEKKTISLTNYIYSIKGDKYIVYIGITLDQSNLEKLLDYYKNLKYDVSYEEYVISNNEYIEYLMNADKLIENTNDNTVIGEVSSQILSKYEELVINGSQN